MVATNRFKKDFGYYFLGIIVPGLLNAAIIPIIKHLLGTEIFGAYSLKFNFLLLLMATLIGGICQSVIRFKADTKNNVSDFYKQVFLLVRYLLIPVTTICFFVFFLWLHESLLLSLLFSLCIICGSLQNVLMAISQANFQSKFILISEGIRALTFFALTITVISLIKSQAQEILFFCLLLSYIISIGLLVNKNKILPLYLFGIKPAIKTFNTSNFLKYGFSLSLWFAIYYLCTYIDKPLLAHDFGLKTQGNYQAMFDIIFRGITGIMSPFPIAILPILTQALKANEKQKAFNLLRKLINLQLGITIVGVVFYWFFGFNMLAKILTIPPNFDYKLSGLIMIISCMLWQIGLLNHKPFKLAKRTDLLLKFMFVSLGVYSLVFLLIKQLAINFFYYTFPFLISGLCYNLLCIVFNKRLKMI